ncbi:MAG: aspartate/glutamate racemase family protein [Angelakisella sp.]|nr:aspartate/glutamate racemase family protein [Angelakisella sp.]
MKILVANPNSSEIVTGIIMESAKRKITNPNTQLIPLTNPKGTKNIDCGFADYQSVWSFIRAILDTCEKEKPDAVVLAGFGNVGVFALKEALSIPVLSISETGQYMAALMGHKYTVLTMLKQFIPYQEDLVRLYRLQDKCASVRGINVNVEKCVTDREETLNQLKDEILKIADEDGAEVVVLGCAGLCGYDEALQELVGMPVLDPVTVTVKYAEMMVETGLCHSKRRKFAMPPQEFDAYFWDGKN